MNVFVTGGNGFMGQHCCARLKNLGFNVTAPTSKELDITKPFKLRQRFDAVIHLAAHNITSIGDKNPAMYAQVNVEGTANIVKGIDCDQFIFLSTAKIYDVNKSLYVQSKEEAEARCHQYFNGKSLVIIRSVNVFGIGQAPKAVLPVFIEKAKNNLPLELSVNPNLPISYIDVRNLVQVIANILTHPKVSATYNVAYPHIVTVEDLAKKVIAACHSSSKIITQMPPVPIESKEIDCKKTWDDLGAMPCYDIDQIIAHILSSHENRS